jgi:hypothetical protein
MRFSEILILINTKASVVVELKKRLSEYFVVVYSAGLGCWGFCESVAHCENL